ncbi:MAG: single-stranded DNA-binding protein [Clostridiales Family XIII bacterium]|nr:single-stranded DNA-binding protein [Clostridiales Family XIII bacterium]
MNNVNLIGRLTKDPAVKHTGNGLAICSFNLAVDDFHARDDRADFIRVKVFGTQGDNCEKYLRKGFLTGVAGRIHSDTYTDQEGIKHYPIEIIADTVQFLQWPTRETKITEPVTEPKVEPDVELQVESIPLEDIDEVEIISGYHDFNSAVNTETRDDGLHLN